MAGASRNHNRIVTNITISLGMQLRGSTTVNRGGANSPPKQSSEDLVLLDTGQDGKVRGYDSSRRPSLCVRGVRGHIRRIAGTAWPSYPFVTSAPKYRG